MRATAFTFRMLGLTTLVAAVSGCASHAVGAVIAKPLAVERAIAGPGAPPLPEPRSPVVPAPPSTAMRAAEMALSQLGVPYRYGGATPDGFDCSGLVYYAYGQAGIHLPRTAEQQHRSVQPLTLAEAEPGDLLFFRLAGKVSHVAIYLGDGQFVHAPGRGRVVERATLDSAYFRDRLIAAGRASGL